MPQASHVGGFDPLALLYVVILFVGALWLPALLARFVSSPGPSDSDSNEGGGGSRRPPAPPSAPPGGLPLDECRLAQRLRDRPRRPVRERERSPVRLRAWSRHDSHVEELIDELDERYTILIVTHNLHQPTRAETATAGALGAEPAGHGPTTPIFTDPKAERDVTGEFG